MEKLLRHGYRNIGITGVPFFVIGGRALQGFQSKEALADAMDEFTSESFSQSVRKGAPDQ